MARGGRCTPRSRRASTADRSGFSTNADEALVLVDVDDRVLLDELEVADVVERDGARLALALPPATYSVEAVVEEVVAGDHEQVVVEPGLRRCTNWMSPIAPSRSSFARRAVVVDDRRSRAAAHARERVGELARS